MSTTASSRTHLLGPLTTPFALPKTCLVPYFLGHSEGFYAQACVGKNSFHAGSNCWPAATASPSLDRKNLVVGAPGGFYSPGYECPQGFTRACSATSGNGFSFQYPLTAGETAMGCCPLGFECGNYHGRPTNVCIVSGSLGDFTVATGCGANPHSPSLTIQTIPYTIDKTLTITTVTGIAPLFQLNYHAAQLPASIKLPYKHQNSSSSSSLSTGASGSSTGSSSLRTGPSGLSTGAEAGIGVAVAVVVLLVLACLIWFILLRRMRRKRLSSRGLEDPTRKASELENKEVKEMEGDTIVWGELDGLSAEKMELEGDGGQVAELEGDTPAPGAANNAKTGLLMAADSTDKSGQATS